MRMWRRSTVACLCFARTVFVFLLLCHRVGGKRYITTAAATVTITITAANEDVR